jgi:protein gp37
VTAENQKEADRRIPILLSTPAAVRFVSYEPALERVDLRRYLAVPEGIKDDPLATHLLHEAIAEGRADAQRALGWVICGAESGRGARPFDENWARDMRDQCAEAGVPYYYKQKVVGGMKIGRPLLDGRSHVDQPR